VVSKHFRSLESSCERNLLQRQRSPASGAPSTTVRSLRELQWSPSPATAGADGARALVLATQLRPRFADQSHECFASKKIRGGGAPKRRDCPVGPRHAVRCCHLLALRARPRVQRNALAFRRSTAVLASAMCRGSIQAALHAMQRAGVTRTLAPRLSEAPRAPVVMPAGSMPGPSESGSDEPPPAGTAPTPSVGVTG
jgi:hypothetical protein